MHAEGVRVFPLPSLAPSIAPPTTHNHPPNHPITHSQVRPCDTALFYNVPEEVASARILQRAATSHRCDDNAETIRRRFVVFRCAVWHHGL